MDLSIFERQLILDDAYDVVEQLLPYIELTRVNRTPRDATNYEYSIRRIGGYIELGGENGGFKFFKLENYKWLLMNLKVVCKKIVVNNYMIEDEDIISWIVSSSKEPEFIKVKLSRTTPIIVIWDKGDEETSKMTSLERIFKIHK